MARTPELVSIPLHVLMQLLNYRWAAVNSSQVGELGDKTHEDIVTAIDCQSQLRIRPTQLADLVHHMKEVVFEQVIPMKMDKTIKNHNSIMHTLKRYCPELFKESQAGEVVMVNYEDRENV